MKISEIKPNILCLEYRQEKGDPNYGSCLWARFMFNLDRYELTITSDCGNYGYKWFETPSTESFLELMARCNPEYILYKLYGDEDVFDYEATKRKIYDDWGDDEEEKEKLDETFQGVELYGYPDDASEFIRAFEDNNNDYDNVWELTVYRYPADVLKITEIFNEYIRPKIKEIVSAQKEESDT